MNHLPAGDQPRQTGSSTTAVAGLTVPCNNIHLQGAGQLNTILSYWISYNSGAPVAVTDICPANHDFTPSNPSFTFPRTWRGSMIYIVGSQNSSAPTDQISVSDMSLIGNAVINGNSFNPVRQDTTTPLPFYSQCNAWDTSNKGIYLQNTSFAANPSNGAFYNAVSTSYNNISVQNVRILGFLGELIYSGNNVTNFQINNNELGFTNGDGTSVACGHTIVNNYFHDFHANATENEVLNCPVIVSGNRVENGFSGIGELNFEYRNQNPVWSPVLISNNTITNIIANGIFPSSPVKTKVIGNKLTDVAWRGANSDSSGAINIFNNGGAVVVSWAPAAPSPSTPSSGSGSIGAGTYQVAEAWEFQNGIIYGQTAVSTCIPITVGASSSIVVPRPASPPANAIGWYVYVIRAANCTAPTNTPLLQNGFTAIPLTTGSLTLTTVATGTTAGPASGEVYTPVPSDVTVIDNHVTADTGSTSNGVNGFGVTSSFLPAQALNVNIGNNQLQLLTSNITTAIAAPTSAPILTAVTGPPYTFSAQPVIGAGTYFVETTWITPECQTPPSPEIIYYYWRWPTN